MLGYCVDRHNSKKAGTTVSTSPHASSDVDRAVAEANAAIAEVDAAIAEAEGRSSGTTANPLTETVSNWSYSESVDEITGKKSSSATIVSDNYKRLSWPYDGETRLTIFIRSHPRYGNDIIFQVDRGQILCSSYDGCAGMINVDGKAEKLSLNEPADHDSKVVFVRYDAAILRKLKGSKKVVVELPMYQNGNVAWTFLTEGLEWPPEG